MIAYATFAHPPQASLLTAVSEHALLSLPKFEQQAIANLIWALALLHALTPDMWNQLLAAFSNVDDQQGKPVFGLDFILLIKLPRFNVLLLWLDFRFFSKPHVGAEGHQLL